MTSRTSLEKRLDALEDERGAGPDDRLKIVIDHQNTAGELVERKTITEQADGSFTTRTEEFDADYAGPWMEERT